MTIAAGETILASDVQAIKDDVDAIISASDASVNTAENTAATSPADLATVGPSITVTTGTAALVIVTCRLFNDTAGQSSLMGFSVSGATVSAASALAALRYESSNAGDQLRASVVHLPLGLTAGSNTFTAQYWVTGGTGTFQDRRIIVIPIGS